MRSVMAPLFHSTGCMVRDPGTRAEAPTIIPESFIPAAELPPPRLASARHDAVLPEKRFDCRHGRRPRPRR